MPGDVDVLREPDRLAVVQRLDLRELLGVRFDRVGQREHQPLAPGGRHRRPRAVGERRARGRDRAVDVLGARVGDLGDLAPGGGVERRERAPVGGLGALGADQQVVGLATNSRAAAPSASGRVRVAVSAAAVIAAPCTGLWLSGFTASARS